MTKPVYPTYAYKPPVGRPNIPGSKADEPSCAVTIPGKEPVSAKIIYIDGSLNGPIRVTYLEGPQVGEDCWINPRHISSTRSEN